MQPILYCPLFVMELTLPDWIFSYTKNKVVIERTLVFNIYFRIYFFAFSAIVQNSGSFKRNQNLRGQNGSGNKVRELTFPLHKFNTNYTSNVSIIIFNLFTGPHFVEYLDFTVTAECDVLLKCKVKGCNCKKIYTIVHIS